MPDSQVGQRLGSAEASYALGEVDTKSDKVGGILQCLSHQLLANMFSLYLFLLGYQCKSYCVNVTKHFSASFMMGQNKLNGLTLKSIFKQSTICGQGMIISID